MSSLWTPDGEHPVGDARGTAPAEPTGPAPPSGASELDEAAVRAQMEEARARLAEVPAEVIVINHAMGLYELAAIHLSSAPPDLAGAALAIDAFGCLVEGLADRLGPDAATLRDALAQIRLAFVQIKGTAASVTEPPAPGGRAPTVNEATADEAPPDEVPAREAPAAETPADETTDAPAPNEVPSDPPTVNEAQSDEAVADHLD